MHGVSGHVVSLGGVVIGELILVNGVVLAAKLIMVVRFIWALGFA